MNKFDMSLLVYLASGALLYYWMQETTGKAIRKRKYYEGTELSFPARYTAESPDVLIQEYLMQPGKEQAKKEAQYNPLELIAENRELVTQLAVPAATALLGFLFAHYLTEDIIGEKEHRKVQELKRTIQEHISAIWELKRWKSEMDKKASIGDVLVAPLQALTGLFNILTGSKMSFNTFYGGWLAIAIPIAFMYGRQKAAQMTKGQSEELKMMEYEGIAPLPDVAGGLAPFLRPAKTKQLVPISKEEEKKKVESELTKKHKDKMTIEEMFSNV